MFNSNIILVLAILFTTFDPRADDYVCRDFNDNDLGDWQTFAATISISSEPATADGTPYLRAKDSASSSSQSWVYSYNETGADFTQIGPRMLCWDYKVFNDGYGTVEDIVPYMMMYSGTFENPTQRAIFTPSFTVTENSDWVRICAPLPEAQNSLPSNCDGSWNMPQGSTVADWNSLISNVSGFAFTTDVAGSPSQSEEIGLDNICTSHMCNEFENIQFHFEDEAHNEKSVFCEDEDVFLVGNTLCSNSYHLDLWKVNPDGSESWLSAQGTNGWTTGVPDFVNVTELFENDVENPITFEVGVTYGVKLAIVNSACGWMSVMEYFTIAIM